MIKWLLPLFMLSLSLSVHAENETVFNGKLVAGQSFEKEIGERLIFKVKPESKNGDWVADVCDKQNHCGFIMVATPPYRFGAKEYEFFGWQFRNNDNSGPNELGPKNTNAPGEDREFYFVLDLKGYSISDNVFSCAQMSTGSPCDEKAMANTPEPPKGTIRLKLRNMKLAMTKGEQAKLTAMEFEASVSWQNKQPTKKKWSK